MSPTRALFMVTVALAAADTRASEPDVRALLAQVDVSDPTYGTMIYGSPKVNVFKGADGAVLLV